MSTLQEVLAARLRLIRLASYLENIILSEEICKYTDSDTACLTVTYNVDQNELENEIDSFCDKEGLTSDCTWTDTDEESSVVIELISQPTQPTQPTQP